MFFLYLSILYMIREVFVFIQCFQKLETYKITSVRLVGVWISFAYILTIMTA